jgi:hypothetical protein
VAQIKLQNISDQTESISEIIKSFALDTVKPPHFEFILLVGSDFDDHELWFIHDTQATLIGTLTEETYKKIRRMRRLVLQISIENFHWINPQCNFIGTTFNGKLDSPNADLIYLHE